MKNFSKIFMLAAFATALAACSNDMTEDLVAPLAKKTITVSIDTEMTRTQLTDDHMNLKWVVGDKFGYFSDVAGDAVNTAVEYTEEATGYEVPVAETATAIYAYYPHNNANTSTTVALDFGDQRQSAAGVFHGEDFPMVASAAIDGSAATLKFTPVACALAFNVYKADAAGEKVLEIAIHGTGIGGKATYDLTSGTYAITAATDDLKVTLGEPATVGASKPADHVSAHKAANQIYLMLPKGKYLGVSIRVTTTAAVYEFTGATFDFSTDKNLIAVNLNLARGTAVTDYYEQGVTIGGVTYSKNTEGAQLVTATTQISANGVYFLDPADGETITLPKISNCKGLVLIGRYPNQRATVNMVAGQNPVTLGQGDGLILKNIHLDGSNQTNYFINIGKSLAQNLIVEDCKITIPEYKSLTNFNNSTGGTIGNILFNRNIIQIVVSQDYPTNQATRIINFNAGAMSENGKITITNTVIYAKDYVANGCLVFDKVGVNGANLTPLTAVDILVENNSFVNFIGYPNGYFNIGNIQSIIFRKNVMWSRSEFARTSSIFRFRMDEITSTYEFMDNIAYGLASNANWRYYHNDSSYPSDPSGRYTKETTDPLTIDFATETFTSNVAGYGATL